MNTLKGLVSELLLLDFAATYQRAADQMAPPSSHRLTLDNKSQVL
jgi:hypothetical protein